MTQSFEAKLPTASFNLSAFSALLAKLVPNLFLLRDCIGKENYFFLWKGSQCKKKKNPKTKERSLHALSYLIDCCDGALSAPFLLVCLHENSGATVLSLNLLKNRVERMTLLNECRYTIISGIKAALILIISP